VAPNGDEKVECNDFDGSVLRTYRVNPVASMAELRGEVPHEGFDQFCRILDEERPCIYHQHTSTRGLSAAHLCAARKAGLKTVFTVHTPEVICLSGTMMRFGKSACDGKFDPRVCAKCWSLSRGASAKLANWLSLMPPAMSGALERAFAGTRPGTAFSARVRVERHRREFLRIGANADRIVVVCDWLLSALALNGIAAQKLVPSRQGVDPALKDAASEIGATGGEHSSREFRLLFLGRWEPVKGADVLVRAVLGLSKDVPVKLIIHGISNNAWGRQYAEAVRTLARGDRRIVIEPPVPRERLMETLANASALAVPSLCLETGPLVVLEAKAAGLPILGSRLGGIAELVREPEDGKLLPPGDVGAWSEAIAKFAGDRTAWRRRAANPDVRTMREAGADMARLYASLY
jgi:glycosyltransferase involved in cell wall biosynthesis